VCNSYASQECLCFSRLYIHCVVQYYGFEQTRYLSACNCERLQGDMACSQVAIDTISVGQKDYLALQATPAWVHVCLTMIDAQSDEPQPGHETTAKTLLLGKTRAQSTIGERFGPCATEQSIEIGRIIGWRYFAFSFLACCQSLERHFSHCHS
jgi:hypothetical protein